MTGRRPLLEAGSRSPAGFQPRRVLAVVLAATLAGCSAPQPDLGRDAARQLQSQVLAVTGSAAANDLTGTLKLLDELVAGLDSAAARGEVSFKRHQSILASVEAVRADLVAQQAAAAEAARVAAEQEAAAQAAAEAAAAAARTPGPVVIAPAPGPENRGKDGKAKGKDKSD